MPENSRSPFLMNEQTADATGSARLRTRPCTVFIDGNLGGGTVSIEAAPDVNGVAGDWLEIYNTDEASRFNCIMLAKYWLRAILADSSGANVTVQTS